MLKTIGTFLIKAGETLAGMRKPEKRIPGNLWFPAWRLIPYCVLRASFKCWFQQNRDYDELCTLFRKIREQGGYHYFGRLPGGKTLDIISTMLGISKEEIGWQVFDIAVQGLDRFSAPRNCPPDIKLSVLRRGYSPALFITSRTNRVSK